MILSGFSLFRFVPGELEVVCAFGGLEGIDREADPVPECDDGSLGGGKHRPLRWQLGPLARYGKRVLCLRAVSSMTGIGLIGLLR